MWSHIRARHEVDWSRREVELQRKIPVMRYLRLSEGLTRQHFYQNDFFQNDSSFTLLLSWIIIIFPQWRLKIRVSQLCASLTIFSWIFLPSREILHRNTPQPLGNFCLLALLPLGISINLPWEGGGGYQDIFWNCTILLPQDFCGKTMQSVTGQPTKKFKFFRILQSLSWRPPADQKAWGLWVRDWEGPCTG